MASESTCDLPGPLGSGATVGGRQTRATCAYQVGHNGRCSWAYQAKAKVSLKNLVKVARLANPELFPLTGDSFEEVVSARLTYRHLRLRGYIQPLCNGNFDMLTERDLVIWHSGAFSMQEFPLCASCKRSMGQLVLDE